MTPEWIWLPNQKYTCDTYAEFKTEFSASSVMELKVSCDGAFAAFINGEIALFSGCADYPHYKLYDSKDVTHLCNKEKNELYIIVWYVGTDSQTYIHDDPGVWFELTSDGVPAAVSSPQTLGRLNANYRSEYKKIITVQLGYSFYYDNANESDEPYLPCVTVEKMTPTARPQQPLVLDGRIPVTYTNMGDHVLIDLGREVAGYPDLDFISPVEQEILFAYGEHLEIGKVSREIDGRDFSFEFKASVGENKWFIPLRRLACRYIEVYSKEPIQISYIGMQHVYYPVTEKEKRISDPLLRCIYDVSVRTLRLCMHEHYEDCPWREQALYALDSRNQMLFGYHAFYGTEYQRSNLLLINQGLRPDGLLAICFPAGKDVPIPFFSLAFILEVCEYVKYTGDRTMLDDTRSTIETIINTLISYKGDCGLIPRLPAPYWNFYEWSEGNDGTLAGVGRTPFVEDFDLIMNAMFVYVVDIYNKTAGTTYSIDDVRQAIKRELYVSDRGLYKISLKGELVGQLGNAMAALAGLATPELLRAVADCENMTPATLSMKPFVYDALLLAGDDYKEFIVDDIKRVYKKMLDYGATSFWETELGWKDFDYAGSLCHGWSASPVYYLSMLGYAE